MILNELRNRVRGAILVPGDAGYESARLVWNGMIDKRPAVIAKCTDTDDVKTALTYSRENSLRVSVRGGGHNVAGHAVNSGGLVIDLAPMRTVEVNQTTRTVRAAGGATLGDIDSATAKHGLAVPMGLASVTGIGGLALGGGYGWLSRRCGLTCDNLVSAEVVTADCRLIKASSEENPDLYWALRGGGGGYCVVTAFEFRAHPVEEKVWVALTIYPISESGQVLRNFRDFAPRAPRGLGALATLWLAPESPDVPEAVRGNPAVILVGCFTGPAHEGEEAIRPLREAATPLADLSGRMAYVELQRSFDADYPDGRLYYWKSLYVRDLPESCMATLVSFASSRPSLLSSVDIWMLGGAISDVAPETTPITYRNEPWLIGMEANWEDPRANSDNINWARSLFNRLLPYSEGGTYVNFGGSAEERVETDSRAYGGNIRKLMDVKLKYDPDRLFGAE